MYSRCQEHRREANEISPDTYFRNGEIAKFHGRTEGPRTHVSSNARPWAQSASANLVVELLLGGVLFSLFVAGLEVQGFRGFWGLLGVDRVFVCEVCRASLQG